MWRELGARAQRATRWSDRRPEVDPEGTFWVATVHPAGRPHVVPVLAAVAAVPSVVYAVGQLRIQLGSGLGDEHFEFGHWVVRGVYGLLPPFYEKPPEPAPS